MTEELDRVKSVFPILERIRVRAFLQSDSDGCRAYFDDRGEFVSDQKLLGCGWFVGRPPSSPRPFDEEAATESASLVQAFAPLRLSPQFMTVSFDENDHVSGPSQFEFDKCWTYTYAPGAPLATPEADELVTRVNDDWFKTFEC